MPLLKIFYRSFDHESQDLFFETLKEHTANRKGDFAGQALETVYSFKGWLLTHNHLKRGR